MYYPNFLICTQDVSGSLYADKIEHCDSSTNFARNDSYNEENTLQDSPVLVLTLKFVPVLSLHLKYQEGAEYKILAIVSLSAKE